MVMAVDVVEIMTAMMCLEGHWWLPVKMVVEVIMILMMTECPAQANIKYFKRFLAAAGYQWKHVDELHSTKIGGTWDDDAS